MKRAHTKARSIISRDATNGKNFLDSDPDRVKRIISKSKADQEAKNVRRVAQMQTS